MHETTNLESSAPFNHVKENTKYLVILAYSVFILLSSFAFNTVYEIIDGLKYIILSPSTLITDYMATGNIGAALFNSGLLMILVIITARCNKIHMNGPIIAVVFTLGGFALFGKNIYNIFGIILGVYIHSLIKKEKFGKYILFAFFGTSLGPLVSQITFGFGFSPLIGLILGNIAGILAGIVLPALAAHFIKFHEGFNLYNVGFTCGIISTFYMALFRSFGLESNIVEITSQGNNIVFGIYFGIFFGSMIIVGFLFNRRSFNGYKDLLSHSGRLISDFVTSNGFGLTLINMGFIGLIAIAYVLVVKGELNGPVIGGVYTVVGFGALGKHLKNITPIMLGIFIATLFLTHETNSTNALLATLFGTTLAPIAGQFGWKAGMIAGFLHLITVTNIGYLNGGINLYNNGFSGGIVAATLIPLFDFFNMGDSKDDN